MRTAGVILPIFSIPGNDEGIGTLGECAYNFIDFLFDAKQICWQILPINHVKENNSPYSNYSIFAGNIYLIDVKKLVNQSLLDEKSYKKYINETKNNTSKINYNQLKIYKLEVLKLAFKQSFHKLSNHINEFRNENSFWLDDYALYMSLKKYVFNNEPWQKWDNSIKNRKKVTIEIYNSQLKEHINFFIFLQYIFYEQWFELKKYANSKNIKIIGEFPLYCDKDSAEVWAKTNLFELDQELYDDKKNIYEKYCLANKVAYNIDNLRKSHHQFLVDFFYFLNNIYDELIFDNFSHYCKYRFKNSSENNGEIHERLGLKDDLFKVINTLPIKFVITLHDVDFTNNMLETYNLPVAKVMNRGFYGDNLEICLPHNFSKTDLIYTSDYCFSPLKKWFNNIPRLIKLDCIKYINHLSHMNFNYAFIIKAYQSAAEKVLVPMQDILNLGRKSAYINMNKPNKNWSWRMTKKQLKKHIIKQLCAITELYGRNGK